MKIAIDIPEEIYKATCDGCMLPPDVENVVRAIKNGTPLPETNVGDFKQAVLDAVMTECSLIIFDSCGNFTFAGERIIEAIKRVPSVEPERKTGTWEWNKRTGEYECSECGCNPTYEGITPDVSEIDKYRYCRWCGARMEVDG